MALSALTSPHNERILQAAPEEGEQMPHHVLQAQETHIGKTNSHNIWL